MVCSKKINIYSIENKSIKNERAEKVKMIDKKMNWKKKHPKNERKDKRNSIKRK